MSSTTTTTTTTTSTSTTSNRNTSAGTNGSHVPSSSSSSSWRSLGWKPLSYPLHALFHSNNLKEENYKSTTNAAEDKKQKQQQQQDELNSSSFSSSSSSATFGGGANDCTNKKMLLNPFFPLHHTVIVAALRELFLLDGVIDSRTLKVRSSVGQQQQQRQQQQGKWSNYGGGGGSRGVGKENRKELQQPKEEETKQENDPQHPHLNNVHCMESSPNSGVSAVTNSVSYWSKKKDNNHKNGSINSKHKRKRIHLVTEEEEEDLLRNNKTQKELLLSLMKMMVGNKVDNEMEQKDDYDNGQHVFSGEELVQVVVKDILWNHVLQGHCVDENFDSTTTSSRSDNRNSSSSSRHSVANDGDGTNGSIQRIRKVSDVSNLDQDHMVDTNVAGTSSYAAHISVVAFNLISEMKMGHDSATWNKMDGIGSISLIESVLQQFPEEHGLFLHHGSGATTNVPCDLFDYKDTRSSRINRSGIDHVDEWLEYLYHTQQLPEMLDLSIILEIYLRNKALNMVRRCFPLYVSDKALREFMGYKSPTARVERVLEILADFLFDVSHAMFAWEKTEMDCFGNDVYNTSPTTNHMDSRDEVICRMLFDKRALMKIGGFDPNSLLFHAVSIKRLASKKESWEKFAKTQRGKRMFSHHDDHSSRIQAGMKRRAKRMKKNTADRSRSSSVISNNKESKRHNSDDDRANQLHGTESTLSNLIQITITREEGKSWGILLAKEDTMCVVMRAPDDSKLSVGDWIVSIQNEHFRSVNIPDASYDDWFNNIVDIFKKSNTLHLEVRRVNS